MKTLKQLALWQMIVLFSLWMFPAVAQPGGGSPPSEEKREEIESMKVAFLTRKLDLTPEEAKTFWPVYNQFQDELYKLREGHRKERKAARDDMDSMSDKEAEKIVDDEIIFRQAELDILKKYNTRFKTVLPMKKVARLHRAEEDFKRELLQRIQERRKDGRPGPPRENRN